VIWGFYHGALMIGEGIVSRIFGTRSTLPAFVRVFQHVFTLVAVCIGWVFFRAPSLHAALSILHRIATTTKLSGPEVQGALTYFSDTNQVAGCLTLVAFIAFMFFIEGLDEMGVALVHQATAVRQFASTYFRFIKSPQFQAAATFAYAQVVVLFGILSPSAFVYFQF
jgi:alginate O-acetyltransferase complex protein AlgI